VANAAFLAPSTQEADAPRAEESTTANASVSGNSVDVENEMVHLGEVNRDFSEATNIKKIFHQMMMQALK
jgi:flagellar basal body rod protein FlgB